MAAKLQFMSKFDKLRYKNLLKRLHDEGRALESPNGCIIEKGTKQKLYSKNRMLTFHDMTGNKLLTQVRTHVLVLFLGSEKVPERHVSEVSHICNNSACINIKHLVYESHQENCQRRTCFECFKRDRKKAASEKYTCFGHGDFLVKCINLYISCE